MIHFGSSNTCCEGVRERSVDRVCAVWAWGGGEPPASQRAGAGAASDSRCRAGARI